MDMEQFRIVYCNYSFKCIFKSAINSKIRLYVIAFTGPFLLLAGNPLKLPCSCFAHLYQCSVDMFAWIQK